MELLFIMDPLERILPDQDTSWALIRAATRRGHTCHVALAPSLSLRDGVPFATVRTLRVPGPDGALFAYASGPAFRRLDDFHALWLRTDPPFDIAFVEATWILEQVDRARTLVVNEPAGVRSANEKLYALRFPQHCPPTLVSAEREQLRAFVAEHKEVVLKPLDGCGGSGILFALEGMRGLNALLEVATRDGRRCEAQAYVPGATKGDKRILLLDGEPLGAVNRVHGEGEERNNLHLGGHAERATLDEDDRAIVASLRPALQRDGLYFVGIDVIGGRLTEVNVTSPTGIQEMERFDGRDYSAQVIQWCEARVPRRPS